MCKITCITGKNEIFHWKALWIVWKTLTLLKSNNTEPHSTNHSCYVPKKTWKAVQRAAYLSTGKKVNSSSTFSSKRNTPRWPTKLYGLRCCQAWVRAQGWVDHLKWAPQHRSSIPRPSPFPRRWHRLLLWTWNPMAAPGVLPCDTVSTQGEFPALAVPTLLRGHWALGVFQAVSQRKEGWDIPIQIWLTGGRFQPKDEARTPQGHRWLLYILSSAWQTASKHRAQPKPLWTHTVSGHRSTPDSKALAGDPLLVILVTHSGQGVWVCSSWSWVVPL